MVENREKYINIDKFALQYNLTFKNERAKLRWFQKLRPKTLYRIGK